VPLFKLRLTYGYNGNVQNNISAVPVIRYFNPNSVTNLPFAQSTTLPNPLLRWEKTGILNAGIDMETKNRRIALTAEYFYKKSVDLLSATPVDPTLGLSLMTMNTANLTGNGIDLKINARMIDKQVKWDAQVLFAYIKNTVTKYLQTSSNKSAYVGYATNITPISGYDPYALISYRWGGLDPQTGDPMGYVNGVLSKDYTKLTSPTSFDDLVIQGTTRPPYFGNIIQTVSWKGFSFSANISGKFGYYFRRPSLNYSSLFGGWLGNTEYSQRWQKIGDEQFTNVPSMVYPSNQNRDNFYAYSEATVEKGDIIKLQDITFGYTPVIKNDRKIFRNFSLYLYINNPCILWRANKYGIDPDYGTLMPAAPSFSFGFKTEL